VHQNWRQDSDQCKWYNSTLPNSMEERQGMLEHGVSDAKYKGHIQFSVTAIFMALWMKHKTQD
jgi:hypothetical protein